MGRFREAAILTLMMAIATTISQPLQFRPEQHSVDAGLIRQTLGSSLQKDRSLTRAELAFILVKSFDIEERRSMHVRYPSHSPSLKDVPPVHWAYSDIQSVVQTGVMTPFPGAEFRPDQTVTRAEGFAAIAQAYGAAPPSAPEANTILQEFPDAQEVPDWAKPSLAALLTKGWVNVREDRTIDPDAPLTRGDLAHALSIYLSQQSSPGQLRTGFEALSVVSASFLFPITPPL